MSCSNVVFSIAACIVVKTLLSAWLAYSEVRSLVSMFHGQNVGFNLTGMCCDKNDIYSMAGTLRGPNVSLSVDSMYVL
jgi:hypothetical protein